MSKEIYGDTGGRVYWPLLAPPGPREDNAYSKTNSIPLLPPDLPSSLQWSPPQRIPPVPSSATRMINYLNDDRADAGVSTSR